MTALGYALRIDGQSAGEGVAKSHDDAVEAVDDALRRYYMPQGPEVLSAVLWGVWGPLRHSMATDGALATRSSGGSWEGSADMINVRIWAL